MDLRRRFDEVLQVCPGQKVAQVYKFAMFLILNIDYSPSVLSPTDAFPINHDRTLRANDREGDHCPDLGVDLNLLIVGLLSVEGVQADVVVNELGANLLLERKPFLHRQAVRLCNDRHHVHDLAQLLQHDNVDGAKRVPRRIDEEQRAMDPSVLDVTVSHRRQLFSEVRAVLVLNIFDDGIPAVVIVDLVAVTRRVNDVQPQPHTIFHDDMGNGMDFRCLPDLLVRSEPAFRIDQVRREERVDQRRLSQTSLTNYDDIELETPFQELVFNLTRDGLETNVRVGANLVSLYLGHFSRRKGE